MYTYICTYIPKIIPNLDNILKYYIFNLTSYIFDLINNYFNSSKKS